MYVVFKKTSLDGYMMQNLLRDLILDEEFLPEDTPIYKNYGDIATTEEFWQYMNGPLSNGLFPTSCYNQVNDHPKHGKIKNMTKNKSGHDDDEHNDDDKKHEDDEGDSHADDVVSLTKDFPCVGLLYNSDMLMGGVRLSTYRSTKSDWRTEDTCRAPPQMQERLDDLGCYPTWGKTTPETDINFLTSGVSVNRTKHQRQIILQSHGLETCFTTELAQNISHYTFSAQSGAKFQLFGLLSETYRPEDAYMCEFLYTEGHMFSDKLKLLEEADWVDVRTRAVMVEFTVINPNIGMTTSVRLFIEFLASGGVKTNYNFSTSWVFSLYPFYQICMYWFVFIVLALFAIYYIFEEFQELRSQGCSSYCHDITNIADILNYTMLLSVLAIDYYAQSEERKALKLMGTPDQPMVSMCLLLLLLCNLCVCVQSSCHPLLFSHFLF